MGALAQIGFLHPGQLAVTITHAQPITLSGQNFDGRPLADYELFLGFAIRRSVIDCAMVQYRAKFQRLRVTSPSQ